MAAEPAPHASDAHCHPMRVRVPRLPPPVSPQSRNRALTGSDPTPRSPPSMAPRLSSPPSMAPSSLSSPPDRVVEAPMAQLDQISMPPEMARLSLDEISPAQVDQNQITTHPSPPRTARSDLSLRRLSAATSTVASSQKPVSISDLDLSSSCREVTNLDSSAVVHSIEHHLTTRLTRSQLRPDLLIHPTRLMPPLDSDPTRFT